MTARANSIVLLVAGLLATMLWSPPATAEAPSDQPSAPPVAESKFVSLLLSRAPPKSLELPDDLCHPSKPGTVHSLLYEAMSAIDNFDGTVPFAIDGRLQRGDPKAPVTLVYFDDHHCQHCRHLRRALLPIMSTRADEVHFVQKALPILGDRSRDLSRFLDALNSQSADASWAMQDWLDTSEAGKSVAFDLDGPTAIIRHPALQRRVIELGISPDVVWNVMERPSAQQDVDVHEAQQLEISGVPAIWINGALLHGFAEENSQVLDALIEYASRRVRHGPQGGDIKRATCLAWATHRSSEFRDGAELAGELLRVALLEDPRNLYALRLYAYFVGWHAGDVAFAETLLKWALSIAPSDPTALEWYGTLKAELVLDRESAVAYWSEALRLSPANIDLAVRLADALKRWRGDFEAAHIVLAQAAALTPSSARAVYALADLEHNQLLRLSAAGAHYRRAYALAPEDFAYRLGLAYFLRALPERTSEADQLVESAVAVNSPATTSDLLDAADYFATAADDPVKAEQLFRRASSQPDGMADAMTRFAQFLVRQGRLEEARALFQRAVSTSAGAPETMLQYADFLSDAVQEFEPADKAYRQLIAAHPDFDNGLNNYAYFQINVRKNYEEADRILAPLLERAPLDPYPLVNRAVILEDLHRDVVGAEQMLRRALDADPSNGQWAVTLAWFCLRQGRREEAAFWASRATHVAPADATIRSAAAEVLESLQDDQLESSDLSVER